MGKHASPIKIKVRCEQVLVFFSLSSVKDV